MTAAHAAFPNVSIAAAPEAPPDASSTVVPEVQPGTDPAVAPGALPDDSLAATTTSAVEGPSHEGLLSFYDLTDAVLQPTAPAGEDTADDRLQASIEESIDRSVGK